MESNLVVSCPSCNMDGASLCYVAGLTCTICIYCGTLHITETEQYITLDIIQTDGFQSLTNIERALFLVATSMVFIRNNWESIRPNPL
jgi:hypothetical protein